MDGEAGIERVEIIKAYGEGDPNPRWLVNVCYDDGSSIIIDDKSSYAMEAIMTLTDRVRQLQESQEASTGTRSAALERAEKLADKFADIHPQPLAMPMEKYFGTPAFHTDKMLAKL